MLQTATFRFVGRATLLVGAMGALAGCRLSPGDTPPLLRKLLTKPSPKTSPLPRIVRATIADPLLTEQQIKQDLHGMHFTMGNGNTWYFESDKEFRAIDIRSKENIDGEREVYAVHLDLVGDPTGEEVEADGHLTYQRSGNKLTLESMSWEKFRIVHDTRNDDSHDIGKDLFPTGTTYHRTGTETYQRGDDGDPARIQLDTNIEIDGQTDAYQRLKWTQDTTVLSKGDFDADGTTPLPEHETTVRYQTRYNDGTTQTEGPEDDQDDFIPKDPIQKGSTWQGTLHLTDQHPVQVDATATRFETYGGRRAVVVDITNSEGEDIAASGQIILDCATGLPLHTDLRFETDKDDDQTITATFKSEGKFAP